MVDLGQYFELAGQGQDVPRQGCRLDPFEFRVHGDLRSRPESLVGDRTLVRGGRGIVFLVTLAPTRCLKINFCCGR